MDIVPHVYLKDSLSSIASSFRMKTELEYSLQEGEGASSSMANRRGASAQNAPVRPVSARSYMRNDEPPAASRDQTRRGCTALAKSTANMQCGMTQCSAWSSSCLIAGPIPLQSFKSYKNDLFGDEEGDVLAGETIAAAKPIQVTVPRPTTPSGRVQQQIALNQQKRLARLQVSSVAA